MPTENDTKPSVSGSVEFTQQLIDTIAKFDKSIIGVEASKSIFRINRDIRFSNDKTPYKTNFGAKIKKGGKSNRFVGYYIHLEPDRFLPAEACMRPNPRC